MMTNLTGFDENILLMDDVNKDYYELGSQSIHEEARFELRKIKYAGTTKWIKVCTKKKQADYSDFIEAVKLNCKIEDPEEIIVKDEDGALIDAELFNCFPNTIVFHITVRSAEAYSDGTDTVSISNISTLTDITNDSDGSIAAKKRKFTDLNILEGIQSSPGGIDIIEEYKNSESLSANTRRKLVNLVVNLMIQKFGYRPSTEQKTAYAKAIIDSFPKLKDPGSARGYEAFFDPDTRTGYIAWRLRTLNRRLVDKDDMRKKVPKVTDVKTPPITDAVPPVDEAEAKEQLDFLQNACPKTQRTQIESAMKSTFHLRRADPEKIILLWPRFLDTPYLINVDFTLMYPNVKLNNFCTAAILKVAETHLSANSSAPITSTEADWDEVTRAHISLLKLLPPTAKGRKKAVREGILSAINRLIIFHHSGTPLTNVTPHTKQPFLVAVGPDKSTIVSYYIAVDGKLLPTDAVASDAAFDLLFKSHFVLNTQFDSNVSSYYEFIQDYFYNMPSNIQFTPKMREVRTWLSNATQSCE